jgi:hypothetical protein
LKKNTYFDICIKKNYNFGAENYPLKMDHISDTIKTFHKRVLIVWAVAILWMYVGNIINFHQNHIWGKQLIPVACSSSRSKEKSINKYQVFYPHSLNVGNPSPVISENSSPSAYMVYGNIAAVHFSYFNLFQKTFTRLGTPLRAPPLA